MPCLFCGSDAKTSNEHVAPQWIRKLFPDLSEVDYERVFQAADGPVEKHRRPGAPFDQTVKDFCTKCNTGWMARLEEEVQPIITPLIQDESRSLDAASQERVAVRETKTVLAFGPTNLGGVSVASPELYRWFGKWQMPLPGSLVWLARYTGTEQWPISFHHHAMVIAREDRPMPPPGSATNGFHAVLALGSLVVCVSPICPRVPWRAAARTIAVSGLADVGPICQVATKDATWERRGASGQIARDT